MTFGGSGLTRSVTCGGSGLKRGVTFGGSGLTRGVTFGGSGLTRGVTFDGSGLTRGVTFGGSGLIRGGLLHAIIQYIFIYFFSDGRHRQYIRLFFLCGDQKEKCIYGNSYFSLDTKVPKTWIHLMFLAIQVKQKPCSV